MTRWSLMRYWNQKSTPWRKNLPPWQKLQRNWISQDFSTSPIPIIIKMKQLIILEIYQFGVAKSKRRWRRFMQQATKESAVASHEWPCRPGSSLYILSLVTRSSFPQKPWLCKFSFLMILTSENSKRQYCQ